MSKKKKQKTSAGVLLAATIIATALVLLGIFSIVLLAGASVKAFAAIFGLAITTGGMIGGTTIFTIIYWIIALCAFKAHNEIEEERVR